VSEPAPLRLGIYNDYRFRRTPEGVFSDRALVLFLAGMAEHLEQTVLLGHLDPELPGAYYRIPDRVAFLPLPTFPHLLHRDAVPAMARSVVRFWRALDDVDAVWLLGPHPLCLALAVLAALRGRKVALGVRQDLPTYVRSRHPGRPLVSLAGDVMEGAFRLIARRAPTVVVGADIARHYRHARRLLDMSVSLVRAADVADAEQLAARSWPDRPTILSVGRLETEKNPLLLADIGALLPEGWRLVVCGEGPLEGRLRERIAQLGVQDRVELRGYLPIDGGLMDLYRSSDAFLHVSWTEGVPQVLMEAFAAGLPVVATAVGGVPDAVGDAALQIPPGDAGAAADALARLAADADLRHALAARGAERVRAHTLEAESARVAEFLAASLRPHNG
jgi:glycosyltransferase involved in cell wall biosynthesis